MPRPVAATALLCFLALAGSAQAARSPKCTFKGAKTVAKNDQVRLFWVKGRGPEQRVYFGCRLKAKPILLGADRIGVVPQVANGSFRLAGTWVAWRQSTGDSAALLVRSLAGAKRSVKVDVSRYELRNLQLAPDGAVAWILGEGELREVGGVAANATEPTALAVAAGIDSESLVLAGGRVTWRTAEGQRRVKLRAPAAPPGGTSVGAQGLDGRFGDCGTLVPATPKAGPFTAATQLTRAPDGALVAAGTTTSKPGDDDAVQDTFVVARLDPAGRFQAGFGRSGIVQVRVPKPAGAREATLTGAVVQPDGKVVVVGHVALEQAGRFRAVAMRFTTEGTLDTTFGNGGVVRNAIPATASSTIEDVALTDAGAPLVTGQRDGRWYVARLGETGALDPAFGTGGVVADKGESASRLAAVAVGKDGTIYAAGGTDTPLFLRLASDGTLLSLTSQAPAAAVALRAVEATADGGAVAIGSGANVRGGDQLVLARYGADGKPAPGFGSGGFVVDTQISDPRDVALAPDGGVLVSAHFLLDPGGYAGDGLIRYTASGARDTSFGLRGAIGGTSSFGLTNYDILTGADGTAHVAQDNAGSFAVSRFAVAAPATAATRGRPTVCAMATALKIGPVVRTRKLDVSLRLRAPGNVKLDAVLEVGGRRIPAGTVTVFRPYTEGAVATIPLTTKAVAALRDASTAKLTIAGGAPGKSTKAYEATLTR
jgi:uncharacterized delta-60 repeat protein